jgi:hypothetical protein
VMRQKGMVLTVGFCIVICASVTVESALSEFFSYKWVATEFYLVCKCVTTEFSI